MDMTELGHDSTLKAMVATGLRHQAAARELEPDHEFAIIRRLLKEKARKRQ